LDVPVEIILILMGVAFAAGTLDAIAGGGGLIAVPALMLALGDPVAALATNKLQSTFGTLNAARSFHRAGHFRLRDNLALIGLSFAGAVAGVVAVGWLPTHWLQAALPVLLVVIAGYFALSGRLSDVEARRRVGPLAFAAVVATIGFYDGIFGPGAGSFFMVAFVALMGFSTLRATGHTKLMNATSNVAALLAFIATGKIVWVVGLAMGAAQIAGGGLGAWLAMRHGARLVKPLIVMVSLAMAVRLLLEPGNPLRLWWNSLTP
jgi:uncharacterized membrane protein YfcA